MLQIVVLSKASGGALIRFVTSSGQRLWSTVKQVRRIVLRFWKINENKTFMGNLIRQECFFLPNSNKYLTCQVTVLLILMQK